MTLETLQNSKSNLLAIDYSFDETEGFSTLRILDQLQLPYKSAYIDVPNAAIAFNAIKDMQVRGAPAIAIVAALSLAVELRAATSKNKKSFKINDEYLPKLEPMNLVIKDVDSVVTFLKSRLELLCKSRPTAVNLFTMSDYINLLIETFLNDRKYPNLYSENVEKNNAIDLINIVTEFCEGMFEDDIQKNKIMGSFGADWIQNTVKESKDLKEFAVLTHCNTGALATAGWGTALGVVRELFLRGSLNHAYCTETRPYNQGSRLTAYELVEEKIPSTLICDNMVSYLLKQDKVQCVIVGADRIAANGDTANKIGTYQNAISCKYHNVPFVVVAPSTSVDISLSSGSQIKIEERPAIELITVKGKPINLNSESLQTIQVGEDRIGVWNPSFDVTPAKLISAIVTENGVALPKVDANGNITFDMKSHILK